MDAQKKKDAQVDARKRKDAQVDAKKKKDAQTEAQEESDAQVDAHEENDAQRSAQRAAAAAAAAREAAVGAMAHATAAVVVEQELKTTLQDARSTQVEDDGPAVAPLSEAEHGLVQPRGGERGADELSDSSASATPEEEKLDSSAPGRHRDNRLPPGPMQVGAQEVFAVEGACTYGINLDEDCPFFPCDDHRSTLAENWAGEVFTEKRETLDRLDFDYYGSHQKNRKYGPGERLMQINSEALLASNIPLEERARCLKHDVLACRLCFAATMFVSDSASTIFATNDVRNLLPSTIRRVNKRCKTGAGLTVIKIVGSA